MNYMFGNEECSSGCESGWTLYLQQSSISTDESPEHQTKRSNEDEDLSMVSDASSGPPPQLHEEEGCGGNDKNGCLFNYTTTLAKPLSKTRENRCRKKVQELDDTASSQLYNKTRSQASVENVVEMEYSQGYSSTQFEERTAYQEGHYRFLQSRNQLQQQNQWFKIEGKRW
ncbi:protein SOB FIVE-LIKE 5-like [Salvia splendens]|uniref:protein SOB FIVE-LIKE 5-like n=1 Tax=Salvia splendens TaxID=180675 RepID=UPI001C27DA94|nr:protein SOB FIVE-LIKE 5-like [Salvia splendens]